MRFSGHETFSVRDGWLHKGLRLLQDEPDKFFSKHSADYLGVGKNMARSIKYWLQATGLAEADPETKGHIRVTDFGRCVSDNDIHFAEQGTWWFLHANLVSEPVYADTWGWFFNSFSMTRFDRSTAVENLRRWLQIQSPRKLPSQTTLDRDVACLLASYARPIPEGAADPEESRDCPFQELGLMSHFRTSGYYQVHREVKPIPPQVLGYCLASAYVDAREGEGTTDIRVYDAARQPGGPGRAFALDAESVFELVTKVEALSNGDIRVAGHAGERVVRVPRRSPVEWAEAYYTEVDEMESQHAA